MLEPAFNFKQINHRSIGRLLIGFALCFLLFACGGNRQAGNEDELIIGVRADDYVVEPLKSKLGMYPLNVQICEPLVRITPDYSIEPLLATRWERHGNTWRFFLRPNVGFSNGQPLRSEAVRYTFARLVKGDRAGIYQHTYLGENSVSVVDELTVDITPERPNISGLNFLGLGVQPPTAEWGAMLNDGRPFLRSAPQLMIYPGLAISLAIMGFNLLGDGLRDALDPRLR